MSWRDRLRPASFRGLGFFIEEAETGFTRNVVEHEYPGQAPPFFEDLGRRARVWNVEGYVLGDTYQAQRDALADACDSKAGPGELVHPYYGTLSVLCRGLTVRESTREGGMARLFFVFVEATAALSPLAEEEPSSSVELATGSLFTASESDFEEAWNPDDQPAILVDAGAAQAKSFWDYLEGLQLDGPFDQVAAFRDHLAELADGTIAALEAPGKFAAEVSGFLASLLDVVGSRKAAIEAYLGLCKVKPSPSYGFSAASVLADQNRDAVGRLFREEGAALACRASAEVTWTNYDEALAARTRALEALTTAQDQAGDGAFEALADVERALTQALPLAPGTLPHLEPYSVLQSTNALVLAYRLYDDVSRDAELVSRNEIANPLVIPGGIVLEVLSSD